MQYLQLAGNVLVLDIKYAFAIIQGHIKLKLNQLQLVT